MNYWIVIGLLILAIIILGTYKTQENFNDTSGKLCYDCKDKTFNQCLNCFNCGFCVDKNGNSACIGGDVNGPYNFEACAKWYYVDPYSYMIQTNALKPGMNYTKGPRQENRVIGIDPC